MKDNTYLAGTILVAALIVSSAIVYSFGPERPSTLRETGDGGNNEEAVAPGFEKSLAFQQTITPDGEILLGDPNAPVKIVEYGDYQCPFCARFFLQNEPKVRENYISSGKANMIYKDLAFLSEESFDAALAANCAADQGKFWEYHDALFTVEGKDKTEHNGNLNRDLFLTISDELGMNKTEFTSCYDSRKYDAEVQNDVADAKKDLERVSTPSTLVNGELVQGAVPFADLAKVIDKYLK